MEKFEIDKLIEKYFEANTSLEEEKQLRDYFASEQIDQEHKAVAGLFSFYTGEHDMASTSSIENMLPKKKKIIPIYYLSRIAAAAMIVFAAYFSYNSFDQPQQSDMLSVEDPEEAYRVTMEALAFLSNKYEKGNKPLNSMKKLENTQLIK